MATDFFENGEQNLLIRSKLVGLTEALKVAELSADLTVAGSPYTSIPVVALTYNIGDIDDILTLVPLDGAAGTSIDMTLSAAALAADEHLHVDSWGATGTIPAGSGIYIKMDKLLGIIYDLRNP